MLRIRGHGQRARLVVGAAVVAGSVAVVGALPAVAAVKPVLGSAYGYKASVSFFGGAPMVKNPTPTVKLPKGGSATPVTKNAASGSIVFGPATLFTSGPIALSTQGTAGNANTRASLQTVDGSPFSADTISSTCTASNGGAASGSVSVTNGAVVTATDTSGNPTSTMAVPTSPTVGLDIPGYTYAGATDKETFDWIFNAQTHNTNGSLTVVAAHEILHGPTAVGDVYIGSVTCRS